MGSVARSYAPSVMGRSTGRGYDDPGHALSQAARPRWGQARQGSPPPGRGVRSAQGGRVLTIIP
jgi:hypothetical protein